MNSWIIVIATLLFSAFFSGMEIAFISSNKLKIELDKNKGLFAAKLLAEFVRYPSRILGALLLGNNIALVIYGISMADILEPVIIRLLTPAFATESLILVIQTIISTLIILFTAEFIPKILFRINPNLILNLFVVPVKLFYWLFYPFIYFTIAISEFILKKLFRLQISRSSYTFSPIDLDHYLKEFTSDLKKDEGDVKQEIQMLQNAIDFRKVKLRECMVPRTEITALDEEDALEELKNVFITSGHSKILIYKESVDDIVGFVHSSDIFRNPKNIKSIIRTIPIVPETMLANNVLSMFIREHKSIAVVVDEFGGTSGVVTMEDIIEEIFGEIEDEYDLDEQTEHKIRENEYLFSARLEIDYINEKYNLNLPESDEYETLGGLIIKIHQSIPQVNDVIFNNPFRFIIKEASETRIEQVLLVIDREQK
ncbi:MAG: HlyC/CorC family transporter [Bacteroidales bacterium]|nr:HlyC/CorC family transporter [Bacteroidales bacterium]